MSSSEKKDRIIISLVEENHDLNERIDKLEKELEDTSEQISNAWKPVSAYYRLEIEAVDVVEQVTKALSTYGKEGETNE